MTYIFDLSDTIYSLTKKEILINPEVLRRIKGKRHKLALFTASPKEQALEIIEKYFNNIFEILITKDDVLLTKPNVEGIVRIINGLNVDKKETLYVGDSESDFIAATDAGIAFMTPICFNLLVEPFLI